MVKCTAVIFFVQWSVIWKILQKLEIGNYLFNHSERDTKILAGYVDLHHHSLKAVSCYCWLLFSGLSLFQNISYGAKPSIWKQLLFAFSSECPVKINFPAKDLGPTTLKNKKKASQNWPVFIFYVNETH